MTPADAWADRLCTRLGAGRVVSSQPRMGWLMLEVVPVFAWVHTTGALNGESFYLVTYLTLLGADPATLALLPMVTYGGGALSMLLVFLQHRRGAAVNPARRCFVDTLIARIAWLGTILWPLAGLYWEWSVHTVLAGVFVSIAVTQCWHSAGGSAFSTWTQAVVPPPVRGLFWAWRNVASYGAVALMVTVFGLVLPKGAHAERDHLPWLMGLFAVASALCIASSWMLGRAPSAPPDADQLQRRPLREILGEYPAFRGFALFNAISIMATALALAFVPALLHSRGVDAGRFATMQGLAFIPALLTGTMAAGWALGRLGSRRLLVLTTVAMVLGDGCVLLIQQPWQLAPYLVLSGFAKGLWSVALVGHQHDLCPRGDQRFPSLLTGSSAVAAASVALIVHGGITACSGWISDIPWWTVAVAASLRLTALVLIARPVAESPPCTPG